MRPETRSSGIGFVVPRAIGENVNVSDRNTYRITGDPIDASAVIAAVSGPDSGAVALFLGTVRDHNTGRRVTRLEYSAYGEMAEREMAAIGADLVESFGPCRVAMVHRIGCLELGEISVAIAVAAPHRAEAMDACREGIERLKRSVPIWKKEFFEGGEIWIEGAGETTQGDAELRPADPARRGDS